MKKFTQNLILGFLLLASSVASAQDIHYSQYGNSPLNLSPGLNGVFGCDMRFAANYRNQWRAVRVPYSTFSASVENKFYTKKGQYDRYFTGGLLIDYDRQGVLALSSYIVGLNLSYTLPINSTNFLTGGIAGSFNGRKFDSNKIQVDNQWSGKYFSSELPLGEDLEERSTQFFDFGAGANWRWNSAAKRAKLDFGAGLHHINRPEQSFWGNSQVKLNRRLSVYALGSFAVSNRFDLAPSISFQKQGTYREFVPSLLARFYLNPNVYQPVAFGFGAAVRTGYRDAIIPQVELLLGTWQFGFSYDLNTSKFNRATNNRGGPEFSAVYRLCKVRPLPMFKICPII